MDYNRENSLRAEILEDISCRSVYSSVSSIINYVSNIHSENYPPKLIVKRTKSVRFPEFTLEILADGSDLGYSYENVGDKIKVENGLNDEFLRSTVRLMGYDTNLKKLMVINLDENDYKTVLYLDLDASRSYPTKVKVYTDQSLKLNNRYSIMYSIEIGVSIDKIDNAIREITTENSMDYIYELRDESDSGRDLNLIERERN